MVYHQPFPLHTVWRTWIFSTFSDERMIHATNCHFLPGNWHRHELHRVVQINRKFGQEQRWRNQLQVSLNRSKQTRSPRSKRNVLSYPRSQFPFQKHSRSYPGVLAIKNSQVKPILFNVFVCHSSIFRPYLLIKKPLNPFTIKSDFKFPVQPHHKYDITQYEELGFS